VHLRYILLACKNSSRIQNYIKTIPPLDSYNSQSVKLHLKLHIIVFVVVIVIIIVVVVVVALQPFCWALAAFSVY
jgi:uncharacterized membrane protein YdbT with pleckstrin-like domain